MKLRCWGTRGSLATPKLDRMDLGGNTSCYQILIDEDRSLILDCGTGLIEYGTAMMADALREPHEFHLLVTHFHWDHALGFPFFHPIHAGGTRIHLYSAFPTARLETQFRNLFDGTYSPLRNIGNLSAEIQFHHIPEDGQDVLGARVTRCSVDHTSANYALRIDCESGSLCYVTDHEARANAANERVLALSAGAHVLLHDAQYTADEYPEHVGWGHSSIDAAVDNARNAGVDRLLLTHHAPEHTDCCLRDYVAALDLAGAPEVELAAEGPVYSRATSA